MERLNEVPHVRGAVVLISPGISSTPDYEMDGPEGSISGRIAPVEIVQGVEMSTPGQAIYGRVPVHTVSTGGIGLGGSVRGALGTPRFNEIDYLRNLADQSGGHAAYNTNDPRAGIKQILLESSHHYVVGYQPSYRVQDGRYRRLEVRVTTAGAEVFPSSRHFRTPRPPRHTIEPSPRTAISGIVPVAEIPLAVRARPEKASSRRGPVTVTIDLMIGPIEAAAGLGELECAAFGAGNLEQAGSTRGRRVLEGASPVITARLEMQLRPGRYNLRCGLYAPALAKSASVYTTLTVPRSR